MKIVVIAVATLASLLTASAYAGVVIPLGVTLGAALPVAGLGLLGVAALSLVAGVRMLRRKHNR